MSEATVTALAPVSTDKLVEVVDLERDYQVRRHTLARKQTLRAVAGVSFSIGRGETFGLVGESGSGKSTIAKVVLGAEEASGGDVRIEARSFGRRASRQDQHWRYRTVQAVLQDPYGSLNPRMRIGDIISEPIRIQQPHRSNADVTARVKQLLDYVGLPAAYADRLPSELSGGQRQRVAIARALSLEPPILVLDEPVSALDVSIQAQVLNLLKDIQDELGLTYLLISHDLAVIGFMSTHIGVLYLGHFMEQGTRDDIIERAAHPYTRALIASADPELATDQDPITGEIPSPIDPPSGCVFHPRCPYAQDRCRIEKPEIRSLSASHRIACHFPVSTTGARN